MASSRHLHLYSSTPSTSLCTIMSPESYAQLNICRFDCPALCLGFQIHNVPTELPEQVNMDTVPRKAWLRRCHHFFFSFSRLVPSLLASIKIIPFSPSPRFPAYLSTYLVLKTHMPTPPHRESVEELQVRMESKSSRTTPGHSHRFRPFSKPLAVDSTHVPVLDFVFIRLMVHFGTPPPPPAPRPPFKLKL